MYPQFDELLESVARRVRKRPVDEPVITSLFESFEMLGGSLEGEASRARAHGDDEATGPEAAQDSGVLPDPSPRRQPPSYHARRVRR